MNSEIERLGFWFMVYGWLLVYGCSSYFESVLISEWQMFTNVNQLTNASGL